MPSPPPTAVAPASAAGVDIAANWSASCVSRSRMCRTEQRWPHDDADRAKHLHAIGCLLDRLASADAPAAPMPLSPDGISPAEEAKLQAVVDRFAPAANPKEDNK